MGSTQASLWGRYRPNFGFQYDFLTQIALCLRYPVSCVRRAGLGTECALALRHRAPGVLETDGFRVGKPVSASGLGADKFDANGIVRDHGPGLVRVRV